VRPSRAQTARIGKPDWVAYSVHFSESMSCMSRMSAWPGVRRIGSTYGAIAVEKM
jgi:hypothetical protein